MAPQTAHYGRWISPITAELIATQGNPIDEVILDCSTKLPYHIERRPTEGGRCVLVDDITHKDVVGPDWNVRTGVQEYGGGAAIVKDGIVFFSNFGDGRVYHLNR